MANEKRKRQGFLGGLIDNADALADGSTGLAAAGTSLSSPALAAVTDGVGSTEHMAIVLDPDGLLGAPEIAHITALTGGATTATVVRGAEGTTARDHPRDTPWVAPETLQGIVRTLPRTLHVRDEKAQGTAGGTFTSGAWQTRDLNTVKTNEITDASLAANQISLPAGTYEIRARAPGFTCNRHQTRLQDITNTATLLTGSGSITTQSTSVQTDSILQGRFTLADTTVIELQHQCNTSRATDGFGIANNFTTEVYAEVMIRQIMEIA